MTITFASFKSRTIVLPDRGSIMGQVGVTIVTVKFRHVVCKKIINFDYCIEINSKLATNMRKRFFFENTSLIKILLSFELYSKHLLN